MRFRTETVDQFLFFAWEAIMLISWKQKGLSGDFATASNWDPAVVPGSVDDAIIGAKGTYTVTSSVDETVDSLTIAKKGITLLIAGGTFTTISGGINDGTIAGSIDIGTTGGNATFTNLGQINGSLVLAGDVSLQGNGTVNGGFSFSGSPTTLSTDNVINISIGGVIRGLTMVNEVGGVIDDTGVTSFGILNGVIDNSGILEETNPTGLGNPVELQILNSRINNTPLGVIEANGANTNVLVGSEGGVATIVGGTLETKGADAVIHLFDVLLDGTQSGNPVNIKGNVVADAHSTELLEGTINNTGVITIASDDGDFAAVRIVGNVTLEGGGHVTLTDTRPIGSATPTYIAGGVLTNVDNTISGTGIIDGSSFDTTTNGILINEVQGIVDANNATAPLVLAGGPDANAGLIEATQTATLLIENLTVDNYIGTASGTVKAGSNSTIGLENAIIVGGFVTVMHGAMIEAEQGSNTITGAVVTNAGTIGAEDANLTIFGDVTNAKGTLDANNATLIIDGAVCRGKATLEGTGEIEFGAASTAHVTFAANSNAILKLDDPSTFTGTVSGLTTGDYIDLTNINFADNPTLSYSSKTHVLTVTDSVSQVTDTIKFKGAVGSFSAQSDGNGGTFITDSPATVTVSHDSFVFAPHLGENGSKASSEPVHELIDLWHPGRDADHLVALTGQAHAEEAHLIAAPDAIDGHHTAALAAHHFLV
jgi:hypothetical protein